jgi:hypothetical protein
LSLNAKVQIDLIPEFLDVRISLEEEGGRGYGVKQRVFDTKQLNEQSEVPQ